MANRELDPITLQVISGALDTIAEEMGHVLYRMSFSSIIRESQDLGAGLFDTEYNTLCESESTPLHIGSLPGYLEGIEKVVKGNWAEGDIVIHNHPYYGSSHSPDIAVVIPIFYKGELVGYSANTAHHLDIGAATPGLIIDIPDVYAEGMLFAGTKLYEAGRRNEQMWDYIRNNSRASRQLLDDLDAQIASARLGVRRFIELMDRFGYDEVIAATRQLMDYTERVLRQRIAAIPDGEYRAEGFLGRRREKPRRPPPHQGVRADQGRRHRGGPHRLVGPGRDGVQRAFRGLDQGGVLLRDPLPPPRRGNLRDQGALEPGFVPPDQRHRARGVHLQSPVPGRRGGALLPDQPGHRLDLQGPQPGAAGRDHRGKLRPPSLSPPTRGSGPPATTGCSWR